MKRKIYFIISLIAIIFSCEKEKSPENEISSPSIISIGYGISDKEVYIQWSITDSTDSYSIFRSDNNIDYSEIGSTDLTNWSDSINIISGQTYYYKIRAFSSNYGISDYSLPDSGYILQKYQYLSSFGSFGYGYGIEFDHNNKIYISDNQTGIIKVYNSNYSFEKELISTAQTLRGLAWSLDEKLIAVNSSGGKLIIIDDSGNIDSVFYVSNSSILREADIDNEGNIYVTDVVNNDIVKLSSTGEFLTKWKMKQVNNLGNSFYTSGLEFQDNHIVVSGVNSSEFVEIYDTDGNFIKQWKFPFAAGYMSQDNNGYLYFACFNDKVIKTDKKGKILAYIGYDKLERCESVNVNSLGIVFASDENQPNQIHVFTKIQ
jgi:hypothetical protein